MSDLTRRPGGNPFFAGASGTRVYDSTFTQVQGDVHHNNFFGQSQEPGLIALSQVISHGAIHDSLERYEAGKCHPGTREEIIKTIQDWVRDPNPPSNALWLYGQAGAGKSAIMQTIAEFLHEFLREHYAGSFFFTGGKPKCDQGSALFCTLAYQIAINVPGMREAVNDAMIADVTLHTKSMETQFRSLIVEPFKRCQFLPTHTPTILIDGLDECQGPDTQRAILKLIANATTAAGVPLRFVIASRPEFWIRHGFDRKPLFDITQRLELSDSLEAGRDIRKFLEDGFAEIYDKNLDIMTGIQSPWPPKNVINRLVCDASGQFIYAKTVLKFVGAEFYDPQKQLDIITIPGPLQASAFSDLDRLYTKILSIYPRRESLVCVLGGFLVDAHQTIIEECLGVEHGELNLVLRAISSLLSSKEELPPHQDKDLELLFQRETPCLFFSHRSLKEYLVDSNRSGEFVINYQVVADKILNHFVDLIIDGLIGARNHRYPPMLSNDKWIEILHGSLLHYASPTTINKCLEDLPAAIRTLADDGNRMTTHPNWKSLLRHTSYIRELVVSTTNIVNHQGEKVINICKNIIRDTLAINYNIPYFVKASHRLPLAQTLGISEGLAKRFLINNAHLIMVNFDKPNGTGTLVPMYHPMFGLSYFLESALHGGVFHIEYRRKFIQASQQALTFLNNPWDQLPFSVNV
ncbi:hypothetical protein GALMADRAFT_132662 [Galerina marginata CBS 339.88]|uniref:Nephrocystin 3-like N-terminal domain-containing protein n=1 Tax=Galerina marginata (strain CBS 339.88) TaxID=685588 RepID=A0A067TS71_GALM3|nr:hypothetical protein GALMADRAFT_132662 [Galerina marginata CBS 339.88]